MKETKTDGLIEQWRKSIPQEMIEGKEITAIYLKEAVDYILRQEPREKAQKGEGDFIDVVDSKNQLSVKIGRLRTGIRGFYDMLDVEGGWVYRTLPIRYNGEVLDDEQTEQFWRQTEEKREKYEKNTFKKIK